MSSFLGVLDIKTGVIVAILSALLNKVAGVYGLIALLTGAGGSFAQLSLYIYSVLGLIALGWGLKVIREENAKHTLYFAHLFLADHIISTAWTVFFAVVWWIYTPHDGRRQANSPAQQEMMKGAIGNHLNMTETERIAAANMIWDEEKGKAAIVIVGSWLIKIYFALLLYSYAVHLRKGSYRALPHTRQGTSIMNAVYDPLAEEDEEIEDFYRTPLGNSESGTPGTIFSPLVKVPREEKHSNDKGTFGAPRRDGSSAPATAYNGVSSEVVFEEDEP